MRDLLPRGKLDDLIVVRVGNRRELLYFRLDPPGEKAGPQALVEAVKRSFLGTASRPVGTTGVVLSWSYAGKLLESPRIVEEGELIAAGKAYQVVTVGMGRGFRF